MDTRSCNKLVSSAQKRQLYAIASRCKQGCIDRHANNSMPKHSITWWLHRCVMATGPNSARGKQRYNPLRKIDAMDAMDLVLVTVCSRCLLWRWVMHNSWCSLRKVLFAGLGIERR